jgi:hypothetical protein
MPMPRANPVNALDPHAASDMPVFGIVLDPPTPAFKALCVAPGRTNALLRVYLAAAFPISQDYPPSGADVLTCQ